MNSKSINQDLFEKYPMPKAVWTLALPTMASMIVTLLYNLADTYFVGQTNDPVQVAAVSLAVPVFIFLMAIGNLFGVGASAAISRSLGGKKTKGFCLNGFISKMTAQPIIHKKFKHLC